MAQIVIISGTAGAGKSTVAEALCGRYDRTVHLETDFFFESIRMGYVKPWLPEANRQNLMIARAAARASTAYAQELYAVFIDGWIGPHLLSVYLEELRPAGVPVHFVRLMPSVEAAVQRGLAREPVLRVEEQQLRELHATFAAFGDFGGIAIDNTDLTAEQTADRVMDACGAGECLVQAPD